MSIQANPTIIVSNIPNWLHNRYVRMKSYFIVTPYGNYYVVDKIRIPANEYESLYPVNELEIA